MKNSIGSEITGQCILRINESAERVIKCVHELGEEELWQRPNSQLSSVANLILHLCGNIRQYAISSLGSQPDTRERSMEFSAVGGYSKDELLRIFSVTINEAISIIQNVSPDELMRVRDVQGFSMSGIGVIIHVTEHLSYHSGQITFYTKLLREKDLGFYAGIDLDTKNS